MQLDNVLLNSIFNLNECRKCNYYIVNIGTPAVHYIIISVCVCVCYMLACGKECLIISIYIYAERHFLLYK